MDHSVITLAIAAVAMFVGYSLGVWAEAVSWREARGCKRSGGKWYSVTRLTREYWDDV